MKKINDSNIYTIFIIATLLLSAFFASISSYSKLSIEPKVKALLTNIDGYNEAYVLLRNPQLFAGYSFWDAEGTSVYKTIKDFDSKISKNLSIEPDKKVYMEILLKRREAGAMLGFKSAIFFLILSILGFIALLIERKEVKKNLKKEEIPK